MIPRTYPSTLNPVTGQRQLVALFLSDVTGLQRWSDYIPVNFGKGTTLIEGSYDNNGYIAVEEITSGIGMTPFNEYVPVFFDPAATDTWQVSDVGFIPYGASGVTSVPSLDLVFTRSDSLDSRITFTRASTATYTSSAGLLTTAAINSPRFDYDPVTLAPMGLLIEESRTNLLLYSSDYTATDWIKTSVVITANTVTAPDGTLTASKYAPGAAGYSSASLADITTKPATSAPYTATFYLKQGELTSSRIRLRDNVTTSNYVEASFDLVTGTVSIAATVSGIFTLPSATITSARNGWYRCSVTATTSTETSLRLMLFAGGSGTGNSVSGFYLWGAQLEAASGATSYIPTEASQVTRAADVASMAGTNFSSWYNQTEGTIFVDYVMGYKLGGFRVFSVTDNTGSNYMEVIGGSGVVTAITSGAYLYGVVGGVATLSANINLINTPNTRRLFAGAYKENDSAATNNGLPPANDTSCTIPTVNMAYFGNNVGASGSFINGHIRRISYFPRRLANAELQGLTA